MAKEEKEAIVMEAKMKNEDKTFAIKERRESIQKERFRKMRLSLDERKLKTEQKAEMVKMTNEAIQKLRQAINMQRQSETLQARLMLKQ